MNEHMYSIYMNVFYSSFIRVNSSSASFCCRNNLGKFKIKIKIKTVAHLSMIRTSSILSSTHNLYGTYSVLI